MDSYYDRLGEIISDRLNTEDDPFETWDPHRGKSRQAGNAKERTPRVKRTAMPVRTDVPSELLVDYKNLGLTPGSDPSTCKAAWKKLLKTHHPDMHASDPEALARSTKITSSLNDSYRRIITWFEKGSVS